ncbi:hypothetical protein F5B22DRAFT_35017 [Xylaria bambusicola]|uniref:uncharacterized protein n=1 Tax=Xylaria bambusicola TaxID=326684 RepID=UPI0020089B05|nr:uncharacterized protein F5B22DRAFT_35017 [Xylaria bambusicola]KAI0521029.1 hypothetical protein F5B22DRAFT_35017 [Xylaria bambusicola]
MQFTTLIVAAASLALGTNAAALRRDGARLAQFRIFGAEGCKALNYGFYTVDYTDIGVCNAITADVESVNLEVQTADAAGCTLFIYSDANCSAGETATSVNVCSDVPEETESWGSYQILC